MSEHAALWSARAAGDDDARDQLLVAHLGLVHHVARQMSRTLAAKAELDELVSSGTIGLMAAVESFDASRGLAFSTFAAPRIRGAILDELRREDHVPRSVRRKSRDIAAARASVGHGAARSPDDREIAGRLGIDVATLWRWQADVDGARHVPLDRRGSGSEAETPAPLDFLAADPAAAPDELLDRELEVGILRDALLRLREQERTVLSLHYFEELKLREIAAIIGVTESRVSQIRTAALARLRRDMQPLREAVA